MCAVCTHVHLEPQLNCELPEGKGLSFLLQIQVGLAQGWAPNSQENTCQWADEMNVGGWGGSGREKGWSTRVASSALG